MLVLIGCNQPSSWQLGPFVKETASNPVLLPLDSTLFACPVRNDTLAWEAKDVFNPSAVVKDDTLFLLYRAEDTVGVFNGTSRIGLAWSLDGIHFERRPTPVLYPDNDEQKPLEWEGGIEDPRIVLGPGGYVMTYTSYDGSTARLMVATSPDLRHWQKNGPAFSGMYRDIWSKSGSIISDYASGSPKAALIDNTYWMYWGDTDIFLATSTDLKQWTPYTDDQGNLVKILSPRKGMFDSRLVEPGPPAMLTDQGVLLIYNGMNLPHLEGGSTLLYEGTYSGGQALFAANNPTKLLARSKNFFITPEEDYEILGQIGNVCFVEGLVGYSGSWWLYYGTADSKIAVTKASRL